MRLIALEAVVPEPRGKTPALHLDATLSLSVLLQQVSVAVANFLTLGSKLQKCCLHVVDQALALRDGTKAERKVDRQSRGESDSRSHLCLIAAQLLY